MARSEEYNSASSQFIVQKDSTFLDGGYAAFGVVTSGMDIVQQVLFGKGIKSLEKVRNHAGLRRLALKSAP